tara:strand:- start:169 stop:384 length:216 start_codon:yes stop_codon:yes gene_type:complete
MSVLTATSAGLIVAEWNIASFKAKIYFYPGLAGMISAIVIISFGNGLGVNYFILRAFILYKVDQYGNFLCN